VTENYPDEPQAAGTFRGVHVLQRDETGWKKVRRLLPLRGGVPCQCIYIEAAENTDKVRISGGERYAKVSISTTTVYFLRFLRGSLSHGRHHARHGFEVASYNTSTAGEDEGR